MGWQRDVRLNDGGWWECKERRREHNATRATNPERREPLLARKRARHIERYDNDFVYRIGGNLRKQARDRRKTLERRKAALADEALD